MVNIRGYLSSNFTKSFLTIFLPFFLIVSLIYLVKISRLTAQIHIDFIELLSLYAYSIPDIVFYTLPISFITALANLLIRLSVDNELIALYALGLNAKKILGRLLLIGFLFTSLLFTISFLAMPLSKQFYKSFKETKKNEAKINIVSGELGQKFGNFYIYVKEKKDNTLYDIVIYNRTDKSNEQFFSSKTGEIKYESGLTSLILHSGYGYTYSKETLQQVKYGSLTVYDKIETKGFRFEDVVAYWSKAKDNNKRMHRLLFYAFVSLIPFLSVYLIASFTMINPRYQENRSFLVIFTTTLLLYFLASYQNKWGTPLSLLLSSLSIFIVGRLLFAKRVSRFF